MDRRLISDTLLRSRVSPLLSFLAPSVPLLWRSTAASRQVRMAALKPSNLKLSSIHTTACKHAASSSSDADLDFREDKPKHKPFRSILAQRRTNDVPSAQLDDLLNRTFGTPSPAKRDPSQPLNESSADMIETAFDNRNRDSNTPYQGISQKMNFPASVPASGNLDDVTAAVLRRDPDRTVGITKNVTKRAKRTVRSRPTVGRTVEVNPERGIDVGRALKALDIACSANRVRQDFARQRFHERPGMQRKRLKSQRWRKLFKESFKATVMRVREMRRKGW